MTLATCPDAGFFDRVARSTLTPDETEEFAQHLEVCPSCAERIESATVSSHVVQALRAAPDTPVPDSAHMEALMAKLEKLAPPQGDCHAHDRLYGVPTEACCQGNPGRQEGQMSQVRPGHDGVRRGGRRCCGHGNDAAARIAPAGPDRSAHRRPGQGRHGPTGRRRNRRRPGRPHVLPRPAASVRRAGPARAVSRPQGAGRRRHGRRLPRRGPAAGAARRPQGDAAGAGRQRHRQAALPARGEGRRRGKARSRRHDPPGRRGPRRAVPGDGVPRRRAARRPPEARVAPADPRSAAPRPRDRRGVGGSPRARPGAPRYQARQSLAGKQKRQAAG